MCVQHSDRYVFIIARRIVILTRWEWFAQSILPVIANSKVTNSVCKNNMCTTQWPMCIYYYKGSDCKHQNNNWLYTDLSPWIWLHFATWRYATIVHPPNNTICITHPMQFSSWSHNTYSNSVSEHIRYSGTFVIHLEFCLYYNRPVSNEIKITCGAVLLL